MIVSLNPAVGSYKCYWWVVMVNPPNRYYDYNLSSQSLQPGLNVTYQGGSIDLENYQVFNFSLAATGAYTFCFGVDGIDVWLKYCGAAGKPGGKRRKQTST